MAAILSLGVLMSFASSVVAYTPLTDQRFTYPNLPYKVDTDPTGRGPQFGYNICNSTTQGQDSDCQTALVNSIDDWCTWGPATPNSSIQDVEAATVAWCTKPGHGTRVIPEGAITGVQVLKAPSYILFTANIRQELINIQTNDDGGELDPHGDDQRGNPLGGLVYSNAFPSNKGNNNTFQQVIEWHNFLGSDVICFKICDPSVSPSSQPYCDNHFDRTGCNFVAPAAYQDGVFEVCESDNQDPVGMYTGADGKTSTFSQPPEPTVITSLPSVKTPASSKCTPYNSASLYAAAASVTPTFSVTQDTISNSGGTSTTSSATSTTSSGVTTKASSTTGGGSGSSTHSISSTSTTSKSGAAPSLGDVPVGPIVTIVASVLAAFGAIIAIS
ncbi:hypothetical protein DL93DRAFT_2233801 [Clavulina sp. PMI_390]|nr:hypothetical protein DL93DRAFT_2233801 [Clavulina sp. PMI_390]